MEDQAQLLARIADALERLAPAPVAAPDWLSAPAYMWNGSHAYPLGRIDAPGLPLLRGIDQQKATITTNIARLASGYAAHDMLLWGARGMGKSALLRAAIADAQARGGTLALVQLASGTLDTLHDLFAQLGNVERSFCVFIDDLGFAGNETAHARHLRSLLDGGIRARAGHIRLAVTANRRAIVARQAEEQDDPLNPRDAVDDMLALADRFGIRLGFHNPSQDDYLAMIAGYAAAHGLSYTDADALEWARHSGGRSGRAAWHFIVELAGRSRQQL